MCARYKYAELTPDLERYLSAPFSLTGVPVVLLLFASILTIFASVLPGLPQILSSISIVARSLLCRGKLPPYRRCA